MFWLSTVSRVQQASPEACYVCFMRVQQTASQACFTRSGFCAVCFVVKLGIEKSRISRFELMPDGLTTITVESIILSCLLLKIIIFASVYTSSRSSGEPWLTRERSP